MSDTLFISDLHLSPERPQIVEVLLGFLAGAAVHADALYVLGDLFEYWVGDDDGDAFNGAIADAFAQLAKRRVAVYLMHGNRDLLLGERFARRCGACLVSDPVLVDLHGTRTLAMHGDSLCTDDVEYQKFRRYARDPENQRSFLQLPLATRQRQLQAWRAESEDSKRRKAAEIMDVAPAAVDNALRQFGYPRLIHGHTHRPARHIHVVDRHECERWVLADWYERGSYLRCDRSGCEPVPL